MDSKQDIDSDFLRAVTAMIGGLNDLYRQSAHLLRPEVDYVIQHGIKNPQAVEGLLDQLLDCAACDEGLLQFKKLLRYYYPIDPEGVRFYVDAYRDIYEDPDEENDGY